MTTEIRVDGWRSGIRFDAAHFIPGHPKCGRLHGHTYALHCVARGEPGDHGFVLDFGAVKDALRALADRLDHKVLVPTRSAEFTVDEGKTEVVFVVQGKRYVLPRTDVELLPIPRSTAEDLAAYAASELLRGLHVPPNVREIEVGVDETYGKGAWVRTTF